MGISGYAGQAMRPGRSMFRLVVAALSLCTVLAPPVLAQGPVGGAPLFGAPAPAEPNMTGKGSTPRPWSG